MKDKEMDKLRRLVKKSLFLASGICEGCRDCSEKECKGWWVKYNLKKALSNIPKTPSYFGEQSEKIGAGE